LTTVKEVEELIRKFCYETDETAPNSLEANKKLLYRMANIGYIRQEDIKAYVNEISANHGSAFRST